MPYANTNDRGPSKRTWQEAWDLALDHKGIMYQLLYTYVRKHSLPWYTGPDLQAELESYAWEGFFDACRKWDEKKGTLTTYAWPAVTNAMNARMKVLERMGSSMQGHNVKGQGQLPRPYLESIEHEDEKKANRYIEDDSKDGHGLGDLIRQPWQQWEPLMEDEVIDAISQAEQVAKITRIVEGMSEPHKTVFELMFLTSPTHERRPGGRSLAPGYTLKEAAQQFGRSTTWAKETLDEAIEYIRFQLDAEGLDDVID